MGILFLICIWLVPGTASAHQGLSHISATDTVRPDVITIDSMKVFGPLERVPVPFLHDLHVSGVAESPTGKKRPWKEACQVCHLSDGGQMSYKFIRLKDTTRKEVQDIFHANCMECHEKMKEKNETTGPLSCGECHVKKPRVTFTRIPMGFDKSLHFRHSRRYEGECGTCHHEYNAETKTLSHTRGNEDTCRVCHEKEKNKNHISLRSAAHRACIDCHLKNSDLKNEEKQPLPNGPIQCMGCHDNGSVESIKKVENAPRINRNQPDTVMIKTGNVDVDQMYQSRMNFVPFDHKSHETYSKTCRECHHDGISSCNKCHTLKGAEQGDYIKLELAMHQPGSLQSCRGCHEKEQEKKACVGCHTFLGGNRDYHQNDCNKCHMENYNKGAVTNGKALENPMDKTRQKTATQEDILAAGMLASRKMIHASYNDEEIPETVVIDDLVKEYKPVTFPHRKVVRSMLDGVKDNSLASYFHSKKGTFCQGCHHNSPASEKPTHCGNCHGKPFNERDLLKPGLMGAYHKQCMECHQLMEISYPVGCTDCHEKIKK